MRSVFRFFFREHHSPAEQGEGEAVSWRGKSHLFLILALVLLLAVALVMSYLITAPRQKRGELKQELASVEREYAKQLEREHAARDHFKWLSDDEYVEQIVRDRENLAQEGETVIHIKPPPTPAGADSATGDPDQRERSSASPSSTIVLPPPDAL